MFYTCLSVISFTGWEGGIYQTIGHTPLGRHLLLGRHTPLGRQPQAEHTPLGQTPPLGKHPLGRHPLGKHLPQLCFVSLWFIADMCFNVIFKRVIKADEAIQHVSRGECDNSPLPMAHLSTLALCIVKAIGLGYMALVTWSWLRGLGYMAFSHVWCNSCHVCLQLQTGIARWWHQMRHYEISDRWPICSVHTSLLGIPPV